MLDELLAANQPLFTLHGMKEQFRLFWNQGTATAEQARSFLLNWCLDALTSGIKQLNAVGSTLLSSMQGLLGYYPHKITNGPLGRPEQQNQDHEAASLWLPRHGVLQTSA